METVVTRPQQRDGATEVIERDCGFILERGQTAERAVQADPVERVAAFLDPVAELRQHVLGAFQLAEVSKREAQVRREAELVDAVFGRAGPYLVEAVGKQP